MNSIRFRKYSESFSDVTLLLEPVDFPRRSLLGEENETPSSTTKEVTFKCHKCILAWQIPYFENLFLFPGNENKNEFTIHVEDSELTKQFLLTFYGDRVSENWTPRQLLQVIKLRSFFCLDLCPQDLYDLTISPEDFPFLLEVISLPEMPDVESDPKLRRMVKRNIPSDYDWQEVDENFKKLVARPITLEMVSADTSCALRRWDIATGECLRVYTGHADGVTSVAICDDPDPFQARKTMISASDDSSLRQWDIATGECLQVYEGHTDQVKSVVVLPDQKTMISASADRTLRRWDIATGECLQVYAGHTRGVTSVAILSDPDLGLEMMISASIDKTLRSWDIKTGKCLRIYSGHTREVTSVAIIPGPDTKQRTMISACADGTLRRWDIATGDILQVYLGHTKNINFVVILPDSKRKTMISASDDQTLRRWDIETGECLQTYEGDHLEWVYSMAVLTDPFPGCMIVASGDDTLQRWDIASGECLQVYLAHYSDDDYYQANIINSVALLTE